MVAEKTAYSFGDCFSLLHLVYDFLNLQLLNYLFEGGCVAAFVPLSVNRIT